MVLKLFESDVVEWLEDQENGEKYVLLYLKLCLKSLKTDGVLVRQVGKMTIRHTAESIAKQTQFDIEIVESALALFEQIGLIEKNDKGESYLPEVANMTGSNSASESATKKKTQRQNKKGQNVPEKGDKMSPEKGTKCPTEIRDKSIEYRDKSIDDVVADAPTKPKKVRHKYGEYQNVLLTDEDMQKLQAEFPTDWQERIERLSEYMASKGASYKNHLATIRAWARKEVKAKPQQKQDDYYADKVLGVEI